MSSKVMKLINASTGLMSCTVCGAQHFAGLLGGGHYQRGAWQCVNGCKAEMGEFKCTGCDQAVVLAVGNDTSFVCKNCGGQGCEMTFALTGSAA
jgi:hypothetical protein